MTKNQKDAIEELENEIEDADEHGNIILKISRPSAGIILQMLKSKKEEE